MTRAALVDGDTGRGILPSRQCAGVIGDLPTVAELVASILEHARRIIDRLGTVDIGASA